MISPDFFQVPLSLFLDGKTISHSYMTLRRGAVKGTTCKGNTIHRGKGNGYKNMKKLCSGDRSLHSDMQHIGEDLIIGARLFPVWDHLNGPGRSFQRPFSSRTRIECRGVSSCSRLTRTNNMDQQAMNRRMQILVLLTKTVLQGNVLWPTERFVTAASASLGTSKRAEVSTKRPPKTMMSLTGWPTIWRSMKAIATKAAPFIRTCW